MAGARNPDERPLAVVDIDGVVADVRHRLHHVQRRPKRWDAFFAAAADDPPHDDGVRLVGLLSEEHEVVFLTGRPEHLRRDTEDWLDRHGMGHHRVVMRPEGDRRPAAVVKTRLLSALAEGRDVAMAVDDDPVVLAAYREAGFRTVHADWEQRSATAQATILEAQEVEGRT